MKKDASMEINHETAMSLWKKRYGKATRVKDFSGREMDKGSYGNRNSEYGWNLDHILPQSQGGKDTEFNLICCHIKTNDEKADKYPVFNANRKTFEIVKVENHYEIKEKNPKQEQEDEDKGVNFFDHSAGIAFFKKCKNKDYFVGTININITNVKEPAILDFIKEVFDGYYISFSGQNTLYGYNNSKTHPAVGIGWYGQNTPYWYNNSKSYVIHIEAEDLKTKDMINSLLDDCILLNTYLKQYFKRLEIIGDYDIVYNVYCLHDLCEIENFEEDKIQYCTSQSTIHINELVRINSEASKMKIDYKQNSYVYDYYYNKLFENLGKVEK